MLSRRKKIFVLLHLSLVFSCLTWLFVQPHLMRVAARKAETSLYQMVLQKEEMVHQLPKESQLKLTEGLQALKTKEFVYPREFPLFTIAWMLFSLAIGLLLLFQIEGALHAVWVLPLIVCAYAYSLTRTNHSQETTLFPSENYVMGRYGNEAEKGFFAKRRALVNSWKRYLITEWAKEIPSGDEKAFQEQLEKGLFAFNVERLQWIHEGKESILAGFKNQPSFFRVVFYLLWNCGFAWIVSRKSKVKSDLSSLTLH